MQEYTNKFSNYIYYHWVSQLSLLKGSFHSNSAIGHIFLTFPTRRTLKYIPTACTSIVDVTLDYKDFVAFYECIICCEEVDNYAIEHYLDLTKFLESWSSYNKHKFIFLIGLEWMPPSVWRLGLGRTRVRWVYQCDRSPCNNGH